MVALFQILLTAPSPQQARSPGYWRRTHKVSLHIFSPYMVCGNRCDWQIHVNAGSVTTLQTVHAGLDPGCSEFRWRLHWDEGYCGIKWQRQLHCLFGVFEVYGVMLAPWFLRAQVDPKTRSRDEALHGVENLEWTLSNHIKGLSSTATASTSAYCRTG